MGKTLTVLSDRRAMVDEIVAAGEVLDMRFQDGKTGLSLHAAKLLHSLVAAAGGDAGLAKVHTVTLARLNEQHHRSKEELLETARELFGVSIRLEMLNSKGKKSTKIGPLLSDVERDEDADGELRYELSPILRMVMKNSNHWAVLSRKAVMAFQSRYSLRLYELVSLRVGLDHVHSEELSVDDVRSVFGVPKGKLMRWPDLRRYVIELAITEVSHLTGLAVKYEPVKRGRTVIGIKLIWREKNAKARADAALELDRSSVGRAARRDGTAEEILPDQQGSGELTEALRSLRGALASKWTDTSVKTD